MNRLYSFILLALLTVQPAAAQWQIPNHAVPIGRGSGVTGFGKAVPGTIDLPMLSNGASLDPTFRALPNAGLVPAPSLTTKCNPTGGTAAVQDCTPTQAQTAANTAGLSANNTFSGNNTYNGAGTYVGTSQFQGDAYFGGKPWFDARSTSHGCAGAVGNGVANDTAAINCKSTYLATNFGGGSIYMPCGQYLSSGAGFIIREGVYLRGESLACTALTTNTDTPVVSFATIAGVTTCPVGNHDGGMTNVAVFGYTVTPSNSAVVIGDACNVTIMDSKMFYGAYGLINNGVDSRIVRVFVWGYTGGILSAGANFYDTCKVDQPGVATSTYGIFLTTPIAALTSFAENHFIHCDVSGTYTYSLYIDDGTSTKAVNTFMGTTFSSPIQVINSRRLMFIGNEFGSASLNINSGKAAMAGNTAMGPAITVTGASTRSCAANTDITC